MSLDLRARLLEDPPKFHCWAGQWVIGGFHRLDLERIERLLLEMGPLETLTAYETGAGLSSAWFVALGLKETRSFVTEADLGERIAGLLNEYGAIVERWHLHVGYSEITLPLQIAKMEREAADFCLIDGGHALQTVFTDFVYLNYALRPGGILLVDDIHIGAPKLLFRLLTREGGEFDLIDRTQKAAYLRKRTAKRLLADWSSQEQFLSGLCAALEPKPALP